MHKKIQPSFPVILRETKDPGWVAAPVTAWPNVYTFGYEILIRVFP
jgi:hypothetical protein